ncbi:unnamed protein product [Mytilus edulis]|uniref:Novel STAND NTPase 3 domain-containing protein n=1 Tax=Mytilus edulis TaxID=6550 RepID=A0A8S3SM14_MYTED|nr:unnamed protein product [Mytilus edulis]
MDISLHYLISGQSSENDLDFENTRGIIYYMKEKLRENELFSLNDNSKESFENVTDTVSVSKAVTVAINSGIYFSDSALVETRPVKLIDKILSEKDCLTITGVSGSGKTVILYQLADKMFQQEGYQIVTANNPSDVLAKNDDYLKQLFVFDDVCGKFSFDPILADNWNLRSAKIRKILKENRTKIIFSCRANISKELMFQSVSILADNICDIQSSEFSMTTEDNFKIAASHNLHEIDLGRLKTTNDFKSSKCIPLFCNLYNVLRTDDTNVLHFFSHCKEILEDKMRLIANNPMCSLYDVVGVLLKITPFNVVNMADEVGRTALYIAAEFNDIHTGKILLSNRCDSDISRSDEYHEGESPLHIAAFKCNYEFIQLLIENNVQINQRNAMHMTALHISCTKEDVPSVQLLLRNGAKTNIPDTKMNIPLHTAIDKGIFRSCGHSFTKKADPNICTSEKLSPLYVACLKGHFEIVKMLWNSGADMYLSDLNNRTPLYVASREGHFDIVKFILDNGADPNKTNVANRTPLFIATLEGHLDIVRYLLHKNADLNIATVDRETPFIVAFREGYDDIIELLLHNGADPNSRYHIK